MSAKFVINRPVPFAWFTNISLSQYPRIHTLVLARVSDMHTNILRPQNLY